MKRGTKSGSRNETNNIAVPSPRPRIGDLALLDGLMLVYFRGDEGFFSWIETVDGAPFRVPAERVSATTD